MKNLPVTKYLSWNYVEGSGRNVEQNIYINEF